MWRADAPCGQAAGGPRLLPWPGEDRAVALGGRQVHCEGLAVPGVRLLEELEVVRQSWLVVERARAPRPRPRAPEGLWCASARLSRQRPGGLPVIGRVHPRRPGARVDILRTPDSRFSELPGYPWAPHYTEIDGLRMHYLDEGDAAGAATFLCLHGQPTWSYLYRKMLPVFAEDGRVVAPDFFGFGRSDKPVEDSWYSFDRHRDSLLAFIEALDLRNITLVCQDWGGLLGLTVPMEMPDRFNRLIIMNTALGTGADPGDGFRQWLAYSNSQPDLPVGRLLQRAAGLSEAEAAAYDAPFPDRRYKAGVRSFPRLVPIAPEMPGAASSRRAARWIRENWDKPTFMAIGAQDPVLGPPVMRRLRGLFSTCPPPLVLPEAGHFVQEVGEAVARAALAHFAAEG